jgi:hypothetical protein
VVVSLVERARVSWGLTGGLDGGEDREEDKRELHVDELGLVLGKTTVDSWTDADGGMVVRTAISSGSYIPFCSRRRALPGWKGVSGGMFLIFLKTLTKLQ